MATTYTLGHTHTTVRLELLHEEAEKGVIAGVALVRVPAGEVDVETALHRVAARGKRQREVGQRNAITRPTLFLSQVLSMPPAVLDAAYVQTKQPDP